MNGLKGGSGGEDGEGAVGFAGGADGDLDVLAESGEEFHEAADAEVSGAIAHKKKDGRQVSKEKD